VLFNEPKLLKSTGRVGHLTRFGGFSALQRAEIAEIRTGVVTAARAERVSVLFNEPKLLKFNSYRPFSDVVFGFSALQRAEIAEIR